MVAVSVLRARGTDVVELTKPRIIAMVMVTAVAGFWLALPAPVAPDILFHLLAGTVLVAAGTNALNQVLERETDALMRRTRTRPLPAGRLPVVPCAVLGWTTGLGGVAYLAVAVNAMTAALAAATLTSYVLLYTPLKRRTSLATLVGAVPGALPILGGWTAARGTIDPAGLVLFGILFLWQLPHFLALAWLYRADYARAGLSLLSVADPTGTRTFIHASHGAAALLPASVTPVLFGLGGAGYAAAALLLSGTFLGFAVRAARSATSSNARALFRASLGYLPALLLLLCVDHAL